MKIYTKSGDKGETSLVSGRRVSKNHELIEAYGTVDELNTFVGDLMNVIRDERVLHVLTLIQNKLFNIGSILAKDKAEFKDYPSLNEDDIKKLESEIDHMNESLEKMSTFILPGGSMSISKSHICRTVCRRAERRVTIITDSDEFGLIIQYLNRLSDYFFVLARYMHKLEQIEEVKWSKE